MTDEKLIEQQYDQYEAAPAILEHYDNMDRAFNEYVAALTKDAFYQGFQYGAEQKK